MLGCERPAGVSFEVGLEGACFLVVAEGYGCFDSPWSESGGVWHLAGVVCAQPLIEVVCGAGVMAFRVCLTHQNVDLVKI